MAMPITDVVPVEQKVLRTRAEPRVERDFIGVGAAETKPPPEGVRALHRHRCRAFVVAAAARWPLLGGRAGGSLSVGRARRQKPMRLK